MSSKSNPRRTRPSGNAVASSSSNPSSKPISTKLKPTTTNSTNKKRTRAEPPVIVSSVLNDDEDELSGVVGGNDKQVDAEEEDEDEDEFEIDTGSSNGDLDDFVVASDLDDEEDVTPSKPTGSRSSTTKRSTSKPNLRQAQQEEADFADSESDEQDSQADLNLDDEEGYNSSDIDALDNSDDGDNNDDDVLTPATSPTSSISLDDLIARHTSKPNEEEYQGARSVITGGRALLGDGRFSTGKFSSAKEGLGRVRESKWVEGSYVREYEEFEAGYGSESSTEEVSRDKGLVPYPGEAVIELQADQLILVHLLSGCRRIPTRSETSLSSGMTISLISVTRLRGERL
jgi:hypothetical protein